MKSKKTKKALSGSVLALVLCFVMLIGTTFAWFTSSDSTAVNKIQAGELKVDIINATDENSLTGDKLIFSNSENSSDILWEPGATFKTQSFRIANKGNLALKFNFSINGVDGSSKLLEAIDFSVVDSNGTAVALDEFVGHLTAKETTDAISAAYYIEGTMKTTAGNAYQGLTLEGIGITVYATQDTMEYDSTRNDYDKDAELPDVDATPVASATELTAAIANGGSIVLTDDITVEDVVSIAKDITIYGNGNTITAAAGKDRIFNVQDQTGDISIELYNLTMDASSAERGISFYQNSGKVALLVDNCNITADHYAINVASDNTDITVTVKNSNITGYCAAQTWSANSKLTFTNCTLNGVNKWNGGDNDFGTIVVNGAATGSTLTFNNCTFKNVENGTADQTFFSIYNSSAAITATGCTFLDNGTPIAASDLSSHCYIADGVTANITIS